MGWTLKIINKKVRFTDRQKQFLTEGFNKREETGRKSDPQEVSKAMALVKDMGGVRRFKPDGLMRF